MKREVRPPKLPEPPKPLERIHREHETELAVGDAIARLVQVQYVLSATRHSNERLEAERDSLVKALNAFTVQMGFACELPEDDDVIERAEASPLNTAVEIIKHDAATSCCRIVRADRSREAPPPTARGGRSRK